MDEFDLMSHYSSVRGRNEIIGRIEEQQEQLENQGEQLKQLAEIEKHKLLEEKRIKEFQDVLYDVSIWMDEIIKMLDSGSEAHQAKAYGSYLQLHQSIDGKEYLNPKSFDALDYKQLCTDVSEKMASVGEWANDPQNTPISSEVYYKIITAPILEQERIIEERKEKVKLIKPCEINMASEKGFVFHVLLKWILIMPAIITITYILFASQYRYLKVEPMDIIGIVILGIALGCLVAVPMVFIETSRRKDTCTEAANLIRTRFIESGCADKNDVNQVIAELPEEEFIRIRGTCVGLNKSYFDKI